MEKSKFKTPSVLICHICSHEQENYKVGDSIYCPNCAEPMSFNSIEKDKNTEDNLRTPAQYEAERVETISKLREYCKNHGDNDWSDDLHMADIIEKHLNWND